MTTVVKPRTDDKFGHRLILEFERTRSQRFVPVGEFIDSYSDSRKIPLELQLELIAVEMECCLADGDVVSSEPYIARFPELAEQIPGVLRDVWETFVLSHCVLQQKYGMFPCQFGQYKVIEELGRGGMGVVYRACTSAGIDVALKILFCDRHVIFRESSILNRVDHPTICELIDEGVHDGIPYQCQALVEENQSSSVLQDGIPQATAARIVMEAAKALAVVHASGVVHFDVKPSNILIDKSAKVHLVDFGLARLRNEGYRSPNSRMANACGSPPYMSPEVFDSEFGSIGPACDIYALGVTLYEFLTGSKPFRGSYQQIKDQACNYPAPRPSDYIGIKICLDLEAICLRAISKYAEDRFASMNEFGEALQCWIARTEIEKIPQARITKNYRLQCVLDSTK